MSVWSEIFDSNTTVAVATFITAAVAYGVYRRQLSDAKRDAANTVLVEIQGAERKLKAAKDSFARNKGLLENSYVMTTESWSSQKYRFIKDFDRDDWDEISDFYDNCQLYDEMLRRYSDAFSKNEQQVRVTASNILESSAKGMVDSIVQNSANQGTAVAQYNQSYDVVNNIYLNAGVKKPFYTPQKSFDDAKFFLEALPVDLTQKSPGTVLKSIAYAEGLRLPRFRRKQGTAASNEKPSSHTKQPRRTKPKK